MEKLKSRRTEGPKTAEVLCYVSFEPFDELPKPSKPEFSKTAIAKYVVSPPWQLSEREVPKFATGNNSPIEEIASTPVNSEVLREKERLYRKKISALMKYGRLPVTEISSPVKKIEQSARNDGRTRRKQSLRLSSGKLKLMSCSPSNQSMATLKYANKKTKNFEDSVTESLSPSRKTNYSTDSLSQRSKRPAVSTSLSRPPLSPRISQTSNSSTGLTWNPEQRTSSRDSSASSESNLIDSPNDNEQSPAGGGRSRANRDRSWHRLHYPLSLRLPEGVTSNISTNSCDGSKKTNSPKSRAEKAIDLPISWKQSASGSHVFISSYEGNISKKGSNVGVHSSPTSKRSQITSSSSVLGSNSATFRTAFSLRKKKSSKSVAPEQSFSVAANRPKAEKLRRKTRKARKAAVFVTKSAIRKNLLKKISPRSGDASDSMTPKRVGLPPVDWSSNLMAIRQLELLALARAERERFNFTEYVAWTLLVVFICFVLLYRSEIERPRREDIHRFLVME